MKNILKHRIKVIYFLSIFFLLINPPLFSNKYHKIIHRRHLYFTLLKEGPAEVPTGTSGEIYMDKDASAAGTFKIIDQSETEYLCKLDAVQKEMKQKLQWAVIRMEKPKIRRAAIQVGSFSFDPVPNAPDSFISTMPHPMKNVSPLTTMGIKEYLFRLENQSGKKYSANLIAFESLHSMNLTGRFKAIGKKKIMLGTREGRICMIYREGSNYQCSRISDESIKKFKTSLCFYIILKKN